MQYLRSSKRFEPRPGKANKGGKAISGVGIASFLSLLGHPPSGGEFGRSEASKIEEELEGRSDIAFKQSGPCGHPDGH
jgi:hypothetical protein